MSVGPVVSQPGTAPPYNEEYGYYNKGPIVTQPGQAPRGDFQQPIFVIQNQIQMMQGGQGLPPALQLLARTDKVIMKRFISMFKCLCGWETNADYEICDEAGNRILYAQEYSDCCSRFRFWSQRGFKVRVFDPEKNEVMRIRRHLKAFQGVCCACSECCANEVEIMSPVDQVSGYVHQIQGCCCGPAYKVMDPNDQQTMNIKGPCCVFYGLWACCRQKFKVESENPSNDGAQITKVWSGVCKEFCSDAKDFEIEFPRNMDAKGRANLVGAAVLVDFMLWYNRRIWGCAPASCAAW